MKKLFTIIFLSYGLFITAQTWPTLSITSLQVFPAPTFTTSNVKAVTKLSAQHFCSLISNKTFTITNFQINIDMCYWEPGSFMSPWNSTDTITLGTLPPGNYNINLKVQVSYSNGNCIPQATVTATHSFAVLTSVGLADHSLNAALIYPNPFNETLTVTDINSNFMYRYVSVDGKVTEWQNAAGTEISGSELRPGLYLLEIIADERIIRKKVLKVQN